MTMEHLVVFDTDRIQPFIFATLTLKEIMGASALLDELNREKTADLITKFWGKTAFSGGGGGLARFPDSNSAQSFCRELEALYRREAAGASITAWWEPRRPGESVAAWHQRAELGLRRRKDEKATPVPLVRRPHIKVCDLCGRQPARERRPADPSKMLCAACLRRHHGGQRYKHSLVYQGLEKLWAPCQLIWPEDMEKLAKSSLPPGYVGLLYADGNRMGEKRNEYVQAQNSPDDEAYFQALGDFSRALDGATRWAIIKAVEKNLPSPGSGPYPVQFFITGGDDLAAVVPAHLAIPVALDFCENFRKFFKDGAPPPKLEDFPGTGLEASMSVGVAIAKDHFPLHRLLALGKELLKSAKRRHRELWSQNNKTETPTLDFLATSAPLLEPLEEQRRQLEEDDLRRYQRPYALEDLQKLVERIRHLNASGFPRNKVVALGDLLFQGRLQVCLDYLVLLSRLSQEGSPSPREALLRVAQEFQLSPFPWRLKNLRVFETPLLDLVELYEFIQ